MLQYRSNPQETRATVDDADYTAPTWQHELDHTDHTDDTDHTDHTDHELYCCTAVVEIDHTDHTDHKYICLAWQIIQIMNCTAVLLYCLGIDHTDHTDHLSEVCEISAPLFEPDETGRPCCPSDLFFYVLHQCTVSSAV